MHTIVASWFVSSIAERGDDIRSDQMILRRNMPPNITHPLLLSLDALVFGGQYPIAQTLCKHRSRRHFIHPFDAFGKDLGVDWVLEVSCVD